MRGVIPFEKWHEQELRVGEGMSFILDELRARDIRATLGPRIMEMKHQ